MTARRTLRWQGLRFFWHDHWRVIVTLAVVAVGVGALGVWATRDLGEAAVEESATVTGFGSYDSKFGDRPAVAVRFADGRTAQLSASAAILRNCRIGAAIRVMRHGRLTRVGPGGCAPSAS